MFKNFPPTGTIPPYGTLRGVLKGRPGRRSLPLESVAEMALTGENHCQPVLVGCRDHFVITH